MSVTTNRILGISPAQRIALPSDSTDGRKRILLIAYLDYVREVLAEYLPTDCEITVLTPRTERGPISDFIADAKSMIGNREYDLVITDLKGTPSGPNILGHEVTRHASLYDPFAKVLVISGDPSAPDEMLTGRYPNVIGVIDKASMEGSFRYFVDAALDDNLLETSRNMVLVYGKPDTSAIPLNGLNTLTTKKHTDLSDFLTFENFRPQAILSDESIFIPGVARGFALPIDPFLERNINMTGTPIVLVNVSLANLENLKRSMSGDQFILKEDFDFHALSDLPKGSVLVTFGNRNFLFRKNTTNVKPWRTAEIPFAQRLTSSITPSSNSVLILGNNIGSNTIELMTNEGFDLARAGTVNDAIELIKSGLYRPSMVLADESVIDPHSLETVYENGHRFKEGSQSSIIIISIGMHDWQEVRVRSDLLRVLEKNNIPLVLDLRSSGMDHPYLNFNGFNGSSLVYDGHVVSAHGAGAQRLYLFQQNFMQTSYTRPVLRSQHDQFTMGVNNLRLRSAAS